MALPNSGSIGADDINLELGRSATAGFSMNGSAERALAGVPSGPIGFDDFHGKSSEIVKTLTGGDTAITLESLFSSAEWTSETAKRVILPTGVERGSSVSEAALSIGPNGWGGDLTLEVNGTISGAGGAANGGVGGNAFNANRLGSAGQKLNLRVNSTGLLRAGGGGGGKGGNGGNGSTSAINREPPSGDNYHASNYYYMAYPPGTMHPSLPAREIKWNGVQILYHVGHGGPGFPYLHADGWSYDLGDARTGGKYGVYRFKSEVVGTTGGDGGDGGRGQGFDGSRGEGSAGSAGGTNAGTGGTGGRGGLYGAAGSAGSPGTNGTVSNGLAGSDGGLAGYAVQNASNADITNNGSIVGRT